MIGFEQSDWWVPWIQDLFFCNFIYYTCIKDQMRQEGQTMNTVLNKINQQNEFILFFIQYAYKQMGHKIKSVQMYFVSFFIQQSTMWFTKYPLQLHFVKDAQADLTNSARDPTQLFNTMVDLTATLLL